MMVQQKKRCGRTRLQQASNNARVDGWRKRKGKKRSLREIQEHNRKEVARVQAYRQRKNRENTERGRTLPDARWRMLKKEKGA